MKQFTPQIRIPAPPGIPEIPHIQPLKGKITAGGAEFKNVMADILGKVNNMMNKTEQLTEASAVTGKVDLHEVMIAMAEEEIALGLTTQVASKFISTVEKLTQMQV